MADERGATDDVERYEQLRRRAVEGDASGWRHGLAVLQRGGVAAWMRTWRDTTSATPAPARRVAVPVDDEVVDVLATIALSLLASG